MKRIDQPLANKIKFNKQANNEQQEIVRGN